MEWSESLSECDAALTEAQRWMEAVTKKKFGSCSFRSSLENGVLLCDLVNKIKPGIIRRVNRHSTPIAGLDNVNIFLKACGKLGLKEAQLFHPGDLQDLSTRVTVKHQETSRRLKNVLITIYWLGRKAQVDPAYNGPYLNLKAFEGLLGTTLYKALDDCTSLRRSVREREFGDSWYSEREEIFSLQAGHRRDDSLDSLDSLGSRTTSTSSETKLKGSSEGCGSDPEAELGFRMSENKDSLSYRRSLVVTPKTTTQFNQFLPTKDKQTGYVPAPLRKKRAERHEDNRRSWASPMFTEEDGTFSRLLHKDSGRAGSKSIGDIPIEQVTKQVQYEQLQKFRDQVKESEDKWQDDLSAWKNRRRSVNSDIMKKKEEREQIEVLTSGSSTRKSKTLREMAEERENRGPGSYRSRFSAYSTSEDQDVFEDPAPSTRSILSRSYTVDNPYTLREKPAVRSLPSLSDEEPMAGSVASDEPDTPASPTYTSPGNEVKMSSSGRENQTSSTSRSLLDDPVPSSITSRSSSNSSPPLEPSINNNSSSFKPIENSRSSITPVPEPRRLYGRPEEDQSQTYLYNKPDSVETKQPGVARVSASLPRSYQRSDSARLTSVVTPRPFGIQTNRIASLPRAYTLDDSHKRLNGETESSKKTTVPSRYAQFMKEDEANSQTSSVHSSNEDEGEEEEEEQVAPATQTSSSVTPVSRVSPQPKAVSPVNNTQQESYSDMRISLNQKPNSSYDFGFQSTWDSTGARVKSIQPGSPAALCHLQVGDELLAVNGHKVADMSYEEWKSSMDQALQQGSLLMDIRRHGKNNWGRDQPSLPFKIHKTINLTSADPLGPPETYANSSLNFSSHPTVDTTMKTLNVSTQPGNYLPSNGINGGIREEPVTLRNKESEPISLKNLKRRSEFFEQGSAGNTVNALVYLCGGSETAISDLLVPPLSSSSNRWSWDPEEERRRQEKWQKEQERLLQEKYRRDQEKLEEEFRKAQQEALKEGTKQYEEEMRNLELEQLSVSSHSPLSPLSQASPPLEEQEASRLAEEKQRLEEEKRQLEEERRRKEEQQRLEEEKRRREQQERLEEERRRREEQERLEEERRRKEQQKRLEEERKKREEEEFRRREEERVRREQEERRRQEAQERLQENDVDYGYTNIFPELSYSHRAKSKSTPELDEMEKSDIKDVYKRHRGLAGWLLEEELRRKKDPHIQKQQAASELELERRRILSAMKYRNPERAVGGGLGEKKDSLSQAELERQQIIQDMKKKTPLLTDGSWIRQRSTTSSTSKEPVSLPMRRGESLDNLDSTRPSWRSSWTPGSTSSIPDYSRPYMSGSSSYSNSGRPASATLPASQSLSSQKQSWSTSSIPSQLPNTNTQQDSQSLSRNRSVSGKKICTFCAMPLGKGAAMIIESLGLCYHLTCFKCFECKTDLGGTEAGAEVRIRNKQLYCNSCYMRVKAGQPTDM
ncbi:LIM domain only protein 7 isoform X1 [Astyanax mexicanus]|uniref:LIM domain only protein 7 isoform X1 n=2 Tax=Astyanax mexicanus TaxID=7994 RepID=UPI0020CB128D|nr:LIM domain only protein 7 isoform X1 [Astyanax mexicanus]